MLLHSLSNVITRSVMTTFRSVVITLRVMSFCQLQNRARAF
jgi:hypothetical protein